MQGARSDRTPAVCFALGVTVAANAFLFGLMAFLQRPAARSDPRLALRDVDVSVVRKSLPRPILPRPKPQPARPPAPPRRTALRVPRVPARTPNPPLPTIIASMAPVPLITELKPLPAVEPDGVLPRAAAVRGAPDEPVAPEATAAGSGEIVQAVYSPGEVDEQPVRIGYVAPVYPPSARRRGLSGWVRLAFVVNREGRVDDIDVVESVGGRRFEEPAMRAVGRWIFRPGRLDGEPVPVLCTVKIRFRLED